MVNYITDQTIFSNTSRIIKTAIARTRQSEEFTGIAQRSFEMARRHLV